MTFAVPAFINREFDKERKEKCVKNVTLMKIE